MYDVIVIGLGSMGSSALYHLAKAGAKVLGIEQFNVAHDLGSHSGHTRIVRKAYFEHPDYVPLLVKAYKGWDEIQDESGEVLFEKTGLQYYGKSNHPILSGVRESAELYELNLIENSRPITTPFQIPSDFQTLIEPDAGFVYSDKSIKTFVSQAQKYGAEVTLNEKVLEINNRSSRVEINTKARIYSAKKVIVTVGAYFQHLFQQFEVDLSVTRQLIGWIKVKNDQQYQIENFPCWMITDDSYPGVFYGFPIINKENGGNGLLKVAHHARGELIAPDQLNAFNPDTENRKMEKIMRKYLPDELGEIESISSCMYTYSPDEDFIIDYLPGSNENIVLATGFSGHGFKFVPVVGEILKDLAINGITDQPIDFLSLDRVNSKSDL